MATSTITGHCSYGSCTGCVVNNMNFYNILKDEVKLMDFLFQHRLLPCHIKCRKCGAELLPGRRSSWELTFRCQKANKKSKRKCNICISAMTDTFFQAARITIPQVLEFVLLYLSRSAPRMRFICNEMNLSSNTVARWIFFIREILNHWAISRSQQIGGKGCIVEIDEAKITSRKCNKRHYLEGQWIFAGIERESKNFFFVAAEDNSAETLVTIVKEYVEPGTTVCWKAQQKLSREQCDLLTVNHSLHFADGTQNTQRAWIEVRKLVPRFSHKKEQGEYLAECIFMYHLPDHRRRLHVFWTAVANLYPGLPHS